MMVSVYLLSFYVGCVRWLTVYSYTHIKYYYPMTNWVPVSSTSTGTGKLLCGQKYTHTKLKTLLAVNTRV